MSLYQFFIYSFLCIKNTIFEYAKNNVSPPLLKKIFPCKVCRVAGAEGETIIREKWRMGTRSLLERKFSLLGLK